VEKQEQDYRHKEEIAGRHCRDMRGKMQMYQRFNLKKPSIKSYQKIIKDKYRRDACRHVNKETEVIMQDAIASVNNEYLLDKQRKHQDKRNDN
jgi:hypothetical protein